LQGKATLAVALHWLWLFIGRLLGAYLVLTWSRFDLGRLFFDKLGLESVTCLMESQFYLWIIS
jgi:hypothetical protein